MNEFWVQGGLAFSPAADPAVPEAGNKEEALRGDADQIAHGIAIDDLLAGPVECEKTVCPPQNTNFPN